MGLVKLLSKHFNSFHKKLDFAFVLFITIIMPRTNSVTVPVMPLYSGIIKVKLYATWRGTQKLQILSVLSSEMGFQ